MLPFSKSKHSNILLHALYQIHGHIFINKYYIPTGMYIHIFLNT